MAPSTRLLLVGAGHTHLEILRRQALSPLPVELTVVSAGPRHHYSGMVPGYLQGTYREDEIAIEVAPLAERAAGRLVTDRAVALEPAKRRLRLAGGGELAYDLVSIAVGSVGAGGHEPDIARHALTVKPLAKVATLRRRLLELAGGDGTIAVVGGGAAGVEVALAAAALLGRGGMAPGRLTLIEAGEQILSELPPRFRRRAGEILTGRGIEVQTGAEVVAVEPGELIFADGGRLASDLSVWLTGAVGQPFLAESGLPVDERGFLLVDRALRSIADPRVFAAGDCATLAAAPETPKAGVYAVRHGPVLWASLAAAVNGGEAPGYHPQRSFLAILNTADSKGLLHYRGFVSHSRWAFRLKDRIDRRFMARYRA